MSTWFTTPAEDSTIPDMPKVEVNFAARSPKPDPGDVDEVADQILRLAFGKAMRSIRKRTMALIFFAGMLVGFVGLAATLVVLLDKAGA